MPVAGRAVVVVIESVPVPAPAARPTRAELAAVVVVRAPRVTVEPVPAFGFTSRPPPPAWSVRPAKVWAVEPVALPLIRSVPPPSCRAEVALTRFVGVAMLAKSNSSTPPSTRVAPV